MMDVSTSVLMELVINIALAHLAPCLKKLVVNCHFSSVAPSSSASSPSELVYFPHIPNTTLLPLPPLPLTWELASVLFILSVLTAVVASPASFNFTGKLTADLRWM